MADVPSPDVLRNPLGTPFDAPATVDDIADGQPGVTIFALLKGILMQLSALNDSGTSGGGV